MRNLVFFSILLIAPSLAFTKVNVLDADFGVNYNILSYHNYILVADLINNSEIVNNSNSLKEEGTDKDKCSFTLDFTTNRPSCFGYQDGSIDLTVSGGTPGYTFLWSSGEATEDLQNISAGTYYLTVTDATSCSEQDSVVLTEPNELLVQTASVTNPSCKGGLGSVNIGIYYGSPPYDVIWSNGVAVEDLYDVIAGEYFVTVVDAFGCSMVNSSTVIDPPDATTLSLTGIDTVCYNANEGSISLSVIIGPGGYSYLWSTGNTTTEISNLLAGTYTVEVFDSIGCTTTGSFTINEFSEIQISSLVTPPSCVDNINGSITVQATGGDGNYEFVWSTEPEQTGSNATGLGGGLYIVTVTDSYSCTSVSDQIEIVKPENSCLEIPSAFTPNDDDINDTWSISGIEVYPKSIIKVFNRWGKVIFESTPTIKAWDGKYKNRKAPTDSYMYVIRLDDELDELYGIVTIIR